MGGLEPELPAPRLLQRRSSKCLRWQWLLVTGTSPSRFAASSGREQQGWRGRRFSTLFFAFPVTFAGWSGSDTTHPYVLLGNIQRRPLLFLGAPCSSERSLSTPAWSCFPGGKFLVQNRCFGRWDQLLSVQCECAFRLNRSLQFESVERAIPIANMTARFCHMK